MPENRFYAAQGCRPFIAVGSKDNRPGWMGATEFTGGTSGPTEFLTLQAQAGVGTILSMHLSDEAKKVAEEAALNVIQCSHMACDAIGVNLMLDLLEEEAGETFTIIEAAGFVRVKRDPKEIRKIMKAGASRKLHSTLVTTYS